MLAIVKLPYILYRAAHREGRQDVDAHRAQQVREGPRAGILDDLRRDDGPAQPPGERVVNSASAAREAVLHEVIFAVNSA